MKVGDLVKQYLQYNDGMVRDVEYGIIIEVIDHVEVPPVCKVWWSSGMIDKEWTDELEVISEGR